MADYLIGNDGRVFGENRPGPDESVFQVDNTGIDYFRSPYYRRHREQLQSVPEPRIQPPRLALVDVMHQNFIDAIEAAGRITFHAVGDTDAARQMGPIMQARVADLMAGDLASGGTDAPAFLFHLGDVIHYFGEGRHYYEQFYDPFRAYDRPIFAIPGNHDGMVFGYRPDLPALPTLTAFLRNFVAEQPGPSPDAGGLMRSVMTQPGVYFTLDAPFVSIIGLYSNVLEGPGVISSEGGRYPIGDKQRQFLEEELARLKPSREAGQRAVLVAVHHPPLSVDEKCGGAKGLSDDIDAACRAAGMWPDAILSGHAHLYQRFTRRIQGHEIPYIVSGSGGFATTQPRGGLPRAPVTVGNVTLEKDPVAAFGYLTLTTDAKTLSITFRSTDKSIRDDTVTVNLAKRVVV